MFSGTGKNLTLKILKRLRFFCNKSWSQYKLGNKEKWLLNGTLNYSIILQIDLFYHSLCSNPDGTQSESGPKGLILLISFCCCPIPSSPSVSPSIRSPSLGLSPTIKSLKKKTSPNILKNPLLWSLGWWWVEGGNQASSIPASPLLLQILLIKLRLHLPRGTTPAGTIFYQSVCPCHLSQFEHYLVYVLAMKL